MKSVNNILKTKGTDVWDISSDGTVYDAVKLMADKKIGALLVMDNARLAGIVGERDCVWKVVIADKSPKDILVKDVMTPTESVLCVSPDQTVEECMALMTDKRVRHLPVVNDNKVVGMISIGDLVKAIIADQKFMIEQLEQFIKS